MIVSAAGMMVELFLASLALFIWISVEDGLVRNMAFNTIIIAGVSTLIFNGNPLLRFDAYYILEDLIEVPNLGTRSQRYLQYLLKRYLLRIKQAVSPKGRDDEAFWLVTYGISSMLYRWFITFVIIWFVAGQFFIVGILLACWAIATMILKPIWRGISFIFMDPSLQKHRLYGISVSAGCLASVLYVLCMVPLPSVTRSEGVVSPPDDALLKASGEGFVREIRVAPLQDVEPGQSLVVLDAPLLKSQRDVIKAEMEELKVRYRISRNTDQFEARLYQEQFEAKQAELDRIQERVDELVINSPAAGRYLPLDHEDMTNLYIKKGDMLGYIVGENTFTVKTAVAQQRIGRLREGIEQVTVVLADDIEKSYPARIINAVPAAMNTLPSSVLGKSGGGKITVDPADEKGIKTLDTVFHYELELEPGREDFPIGLRAYVRFHHGDEPLMVQGYRYVRQLFLGRFGV